jgi:hypothetical protein
MHVIATCVNGPQERYVNGILFDITDQMRSKEALAAKGRELAYRTDNLSEVNTALKVLLKKRDEDRKALEEKVLYNVKSLIRPYLNKMKHSGLNAKQKAYLEILDSNLNEIISPLSRKLIFDYLGFTPTEIKVATMVKQGKKAREIAKHAWHLRPDGRRVSIRHPRSARHQRQEGKPADLPAIHPVVSPFRNGILRPRLCLLRDIEHGVKRQRNPRFSAATPSVSLPLWP